MISSIRHSAFVVKDLEESLKFYKDTLDLELYRREVEQGDFIESLTGLKGVKLEWAKLIIPKGGLIELLQYHTHPDQSSISESPSNKIGASHVALTVDDLSLLYSKIIANGYTCKSEPLIAPGGKAKILYCHDPDGAILELIEDL
tara:strand:+ start:2358 stop:2792 length:435 start_codon:yes stop_codon:yes gene_type:complete